MKKRREKNLGFVGIYMSKRWSGRDVGATSVLLVALPRPTRGS